MISGHFVAAGVEPERTKTILVSFRVLDPTSGGGGRRNNSSTDDGEEDVGNNHGHLCERADLNCVSSCWSCCLQFAAIICPWCLSHLPVVRLLNN